MRKKTFRYPRRGLGATLVELVMSIVVIGVAVTGVVMVIDRNVRTSADPVVNQQAIAIAEAYLEEILTKDFNVQPGATRPTFDDVDDYNGLPDTVVRDQTDAAIAGLGGYNVTVAVANEAFGSPAVAAADAKRVQVTVSGPGGVSVVVSGYRTNY